MKNQIKFILLFLLTCITCTTIFACGGNDTPEESDKPSDTDTESAPPVVTQTVDLSKYSIIYPQNFNFATRSASISLRTQLNDAGISLTLGQESEYEILLGAVDSAETNEAVAALDEENEYVIRFYEKKIVITAKNDLVLQEAVDTFVSKYVSKAEDGALTFTVGETYTAKSDNLAVLVQEGKAEYEIVLGSSSEQVKAKANELVAAIADLSENATVSIGGTYDETRKQIVIGCPENSATKAILDTLEINEYVMQKADDHILLAGHDDETTLLAIGTMITQLRTVANQVGKSGTLALSLPTPIVNQNIVPLKDIPEFTGGTYVDTYPCGNRNTQRYYTDADATRIDAYVEKLELAGYFNTEDNTIGDNRYVTCISKNGMVHITYLAYNKTLSVLSDPMDNTVYKPDEPEYTKVTETTLAVMSLDYSHREEIDGNGMSYVVTLEDGRYIIFDGGYKNSADANILYNYLADNNKRSDGKIVIAAWVMTHPHGDHVGVFQTFTFQYSGRVKVEYFIYNDGDPSMFNQKPGEHLSKVVPQLISQYYSDAKIIKPHTGQKLTFCNTVFEVMYTQENYAPNLMPWVNDSSLVLRMNANGVKVLFMGDCEVGSSGVISKMYGNELKSDIIQINHHGFSGGTIELYQYVDPSYTMWPTSQLAFDNRTTDGKLGYVSSAGLESNKYIFDKVGADHCFVADGDIEMLVLNKGGIENMTVEKYTPHHS